MGVNAQTAVPAFVAGEILTAAEMTQVNTGIPVFATTVTRDAAFGGAGEKVLAEGQYAYIEATNTTQFYDGSAWQPVGGGLDFITGASFTTATSVSLPNGTFNSDYKNYRVMFSLTACTGTINITTRFRNGGTDNTAAHYFQTSFIYNGAGNTVVDNATTSFTFNPADVLAIYNVSLDFWSPNVSSAAHSITGLTTFYDAAQPRGGTRNGFHYTATPQTFDSFSFISGTASSMTGFYRVYGYSES